MHSIDHVYRHIKKYKGKHSLLYLVSSMVFFFVIFDGIVSYIVPILITSTGLSDTSMGLILGASSIAGALFDFLLCSTLKDTHFRRTFLFMLLMAVFSLLLIWHATTVLLFLIVAIVWGMYYDFYHIALFDFVSRRTAKKEHASSFGVISVFSSLGYLIAPLLAGLVITNVINSKVLVLALIFLGISTMLYLFLAGISKRDGNDKYKKFYPPMKLAAEYRLWKKIGSFIMPVLILTLFLNMLDSFFWTIGPLLSQSFVSLGGLGSLFLVAYMLPSLFIGWFVGSITRRIGQKRTAFTALLIGSIILCSMFLIHGGLLLIVDSLVASFFLSFAWPSINGTYGDYISENPQIGREIETLQDSFTNLGYIVGPILAGVLSDNIGFTGAFSVLGAIGMICAICLMIVTPRHINIRVRRA